jgi:hypothetical protein
MHTCCTNPSGYPEQLEIVEQRKDGKFQDVLTLDVFDRELQDLRAEVLKLRRELKICRAIMGLLVALVRSVGLKLNDQRLPEGEQKERVLKAVEGART